MWIFSRKKVFVYDPKTQQKKAIYEIPTYVGCCAPTRNSKKLLIGTQEGLQILDLETSQIITMVHLHKLEPGKLKNRFNQGRVDAKGRLWAGTIYISLTSKQDVQQHQGTVYSLEPDGSVFRKIENVSTSNGIAWSLDSLVMYHTDSITRSVAAYDYDLEKGEISNKRIAINVPDNLGWPCGMTIDAEDKLWIALWEGSCVTRWDPISGTLLHKIILPTPHITNLCFGGDKLDVLYVTSARSKVDRVRYPSGGSIFAITNIGVKGVAMNYFGEKLERRVL